jgi:DNA polymerase
MTDRAALDRYLRQLAEMGGPDLYLDRFDRDTARRIAMGAAASAAGKPGTAGAEATGPDALRAAVSPGPEAPAGTTPGAVPLPVVPAAALRPAPRTATPDVVGELDELSTVAAGCVQCRLHETRSKVVFGEGNRAADLVVVGEAPGQEEDRTGRPFVGRAGRLLDLMLMASGFPRDEVYICNVLKCRPPGNRNPQSDEMDVCSRSFLHRQLELIAPRILLAVGRFAVQALLDSTAALGRLRGRLHAYQGIPLVVSYHPAYLLRSPNLLRTAWDDYQLIRQVLDDPV